MLAWKLLTLTRCLESGLHLDETRPNDPSSTLHDHLGSRAEKTCTTAFFRFTQATRVESGDQFKFYRREKFLLWLVRTFQSLVPQQSQSDAWGVHYKKRVKKSQRDGPWTCFPIFALSKSLEDWNELDAYLQGSNHYVVNFSITYQSKNQQERINPSQLSVLSCLHQCATYSTERLLSNTSCVESHLIYWLFHVSSILQLDLTTHRTVKISNRHHLLCSSKRGLRMKMEKLLDSHREILVLIDWSWLLSHQKVPVFATSVSTGEPRYDFEVTERLLVTLSSFNPNSTNPRDSSL